MSIESLSIILGADAVFRFLALGYELIGNGIELHHPSARVVMGEFEPERLSLDLEALSPRLRTRLTMAVGCFKEEEQRLESLCAACAVVLDDSLIRLDRLKVESIKYKDVEEGLKKALQGVWPKPDVDALRLRLSKLRIELEGKVSPFLR